MGDMQPSIAVINRYTLCCESFETVKCPMPAAGREDGSQWNRKSRSWNSFLAGHLPTDF